MRTSAMEDSNLESTPTKRGLNDRLEALKAKLQLLEKKRLLKEKKKDPSFTSMMKIRRTLIKAIEIFEQDKEKIPLEILSLSKRLIYAINEVENQVAQQEVEAAPERDEAFEA
jgi:hypothetical protein